jgi:hypothetical protein
MASWLTMIIALLLTISSVTAVHLFVMKSVDSFTGYGERSSRYEWDSFQNKYKF